MISTNWAPSSKDPAAEQQVASSCTAVSATIGSSTEKSYWTICSELHGKPAFGLIMDPTPTTFAGDLVRCRVHLDILARAREITRNRRVEATRLAVLYQPAVSYSNAFSY
jgi:hypothetical protein